MCLLSCVLNPLDLQCTGGSYGSACEISLGGEKESMSLSITRYSSKLKKLKEKGKL